MNSSISGFFSSSSSFPLLLPLAPPACEPARPQFDIFERSSALFFFFPRFWVRACACVSFLFLFVLFFNLKHPLLRLILDESNGPLELVLLRLVVDFGPRDLVLLAPLRGDPRVEVVQL